MDMGEQALFCPQHSDALERGGGYPPSRVPSRRPATVPDAKYQLQRHL